MTQFMTAMEEAIARTRIAATVARYNAHVDVGNVDGVMTTFDHAAVLTPSKGVYEGAVAIREFYEIVVGDKRMDADKPKPLLRHGLTTHLVEFTSADSATGRLYYMVSTVHGHDHTGLYEDEFIRRGDEWLIYRRRIMIEWFASPSWFEERRLRAAK